MATRNGEKEDKRCETVRKGMARALGEGTRAALMGAGEIRGG